METIQPQQTDYGFQSVEAAVPTLPTAAATVPATEPASESARLVARIVPAVLERSAFEYHLEEYVREFQPVGHAELMVVRDLARHTTAMEGWNEGVGALQRQRAQRLPEIVLSEGEEDDDLEDVSLAASISAPEVHLSEQHAQRRSRAFHRGLRALSELQARRTSRGKGPEPVTSRNYFPTERACEEYLQKRFEQGCYQCPRCGSRRGHYLVARRSWECAGCSRQTGLRADTVAADSPLPLMAWFSAIHILLFQPTTGTTELASKLGITRSTTVRNMAKKILTVMAENDTSELLAGLDVLYARCPTASPESGAADSQNQGSGTADTKGPSRSDASVADMQS